MTSALAAESPSGVHVRRRAAFLDAMASACPSALAVLPSAPPALRNNDVEHEYRQDSDFYYLTGFDEPGSLALLDAKERTFTLVVRPRDRDREIWDGERAGVDGAKAKFGADQAFPASEMDDRLATAMQDRRRIYYRLGANRFQVWHFQPVDILEGPAVPDMKVKSRHVRRRLIERDQFLTSE